MWLNLIFKQKALFSQNAYVSMTIYEVPGMGAQKDIFASVDDTFFCKLGIHFHVTDENIKV